MMLVLPTSTYLVARGEEGYATKLLLSSCEGVPRKEIAYMKDGDVEYAPIMRCEESSANFKVVKGRAFSALISKESGLVLTDDGSAVTPAPVSLGRVRRFEHQHLAHVLGFALARSGGGDIEGAWIKYPGDAVKHAPVALLEEVGGVEEVLWGIALGGSADVEGFVSGLAIGMGGTGVRIRLDRGALQALTLILRRGGVKHRVVEGEVIIESVMDVLIPYRGAGGRWVEPVEHGDGVMHGSIMLEVATDHPLIVGYVGWYLAK